MSMQTVGFSLSDTLQPNALLRLTISSNWYDLAGQFSGAVRILYDSLFQVARVIPTTRLVVVSDSKSAVVDASLKEQKTGADLVNALQRTGQRFAFVSKVEVLTGSARAGSSSTDGQAARDAAAQKAQDKANSESAMSRMLSGFGQLGTVIKWGGVGIAVLAVLYLASPYLAHRKR